MPSENIQVAVFVRPFTERELTEESVCIVEGEDGQVKVDNSENSRAKVFNFDHTYWSVDQASDSYIPRAKGIEELGDSLLSSAFEGYNVCAFSYGASNSGKTCVMFGTNDNPGLIPWICNELFTSAASYSDDTSFRMEISFLEIHKEFVKDLLGRRRNWQDSLRVREHPEFGTRVDKLTKHIVTEVTEVLNLIEKGKKNRSVCSRSSDNFFSSSHTIFTIKFTQARLEDGMPCEKISTIQLVDLAGNKSIHAECSSNEAGEDLEAPSSSSGKPDQSLLTLDQVISALASKNTSPRLSVPPPYTDSALTLILKDCFGGNCRTIMVAAVSPSSTSLHETLSTLRYANQVKKVVNYPSINEDGNVKLIKELKVEIQGLKTMMKEGQTQVNGGTEKTARKLQENEDLMKRLTGIWEDKWSRTQKIIEERALEVTELGSALKFETEEPHFVSLGGGRLSIGVTICPIKRGEPPPPFIVDVSPHSYPTHPTPPPPELQSEPL